MTRRRENKGKRISTLKNVGAKALQELHIRNGKTIQKKTRKKTKREPEKMRT
jgi:hypothetical protein